ncbi:MAG: hypothetical protein QM783_07215 [Phycisphaerales bacterium]
MADKSFAIRLVTPAGKLLDGQATYAMVPAHDGLMGFQPNRAPIVFELGLGELRVDFANEGKAGGGGGGAAAATSSRTASGRWPTTGSRS